MPSVNKIFLMGNLTRDPDLRYIPSGQAVAEFGLAVNEKRKDKEDEVIFVDCVVWSKSAENCAMYLVRGSPVFIEGKLKLETWLDKETGKNRSKIKVTALNVQFLSGGKGKQDAGKAPDGMFDDLPNDDEVPF